MAGRSWLIRNARVIDPAGGVDLTADILIEGSAVTAVGGHIDAPGAQVIEAAGLVAAPGLVDMHVHLRDPGQEAKEDILSGCRAAAAGGVTSLAAMPNTRPVIDSPELVDYVIKKALRTGVKVYPIAAATLGQQGLELADFSALSLAGAVAFSDDGRPVMSAALMAGAMLEAARVGRVVISHCEDASFAGGIVNEGAVSLELGVKGIPAAAEEVQVARETALAAAFGARVHIAHVSTARSVATVRDAKRRGAPVTCETCPHYFSLDESLLLTRDADYRMNPPLRTKADVTAVAEGLCDGTIDAIVTDHAPHTAQEKADFERAPNGVVGLETMLAAGITYLVRPGLLTLAQLIEKCSPGPARILGLNAGRIAPGSPADITLFDPGKEWLVKPEKLHSKSHNTPYKGMRLYGRVKYTFCNGMPVFVEK